MPPLFQTGRSLRRLLIPTVAVAFSLLSCGREITGPDGGLRFAHGISFLAEYPGRFANAAEGAGSVVAFDRVRVLFVRADGTTALDQMVAFGPGTDSVALTLTIPLSSSAPASGEPLDFSLFYLNAAGDTVFRGGPLRVVATPSDRNAPPPQPIAIALSYTGPGAAAVSVAIMPETLTVMSGDPFAFTATAQNAQQAAEPDAPLVFTSLDPLLAVLPSRASGSGTAGVGRGTARVQVSLATDADSDTAVLIITPRPASLVVTAGGEQTAPAGSPLSDSVRVRLLATDGLGIAQAAITVAVTTGGGSVAPTPLVTDAEGRAAVAWTLGGAPGAQSVTVSSAGVPNLVVGATAGDPPLVATQLVVAQQPGALQVVGANTAPALRVEARDAAGVLVPSFTDSVRIAFGVNPSLAVLGGEVAVAAVAGVATFGAWNVSALGSGYTVVATATGLTAATTQPFDVGSGGAALLAIVSGDGQTGYTAQPLESPIVVRVTDALGGVVPGAAVAFAVTTGGGSITGASVLTNAAGEATLASWTLGATPGTNAVTATVDGVAPLIITATGVLPPPAIELSVFGSTVVGIERAGTLNVRLLQPAPVGGLTVSIVSNDPQFLTIAAPGTVAFTAGQTLRTIEVSGIALGNAVVVATAPDYAPDTLVVPVSLNLISMPAALNVPLAQTRSLPIQLSAAAPAGGVAIALSSSAPGTARPTADTVVIAAGTQSVNATIEGLALGSATIRATNPNYALDETMVGVTAELNIVATSVALNGTFGASLTVRLESGGTPVAAPVGGVAVALTSDNAACASIAPNATIGAGFVSVSLDVTYGGVAPLPCSTRLRVTGPEGFAPDSVTANVAVAPGFNRPASTIGSGLQRSIGGSLGASNHGGVTVRVTSLDSSIVLVAPNATTNGAGSYETVVLPGATSFPLVISSLAGIIGDTVAVRLEAPGFTSLDFGVYVWQPVFQLSGLLASVSTLAVDDAFSVTVGTPQTPAGTSIWWGDDVRRGGGPLTVNIVNDTARIGELVTTAGTADSVSVLIAEGVNNTPTSVAAGGVAFRPSSAGLTNIRSVIAGFRPLSAAELQVTVSQPTISLATDYLGSGLQRSRTVSTPGSPAPAGGTPITIAAERLGVVQFAPNATTVGVDMLEVLIPAGGTSATFWVQAADGIAGDTVNLTASAPGFASATAQQRVWASVYQLTGLTASGTPLTADDAFYVSIGTPSSPAGASIWIADNRRAGAPPLEVSVVSGSPAVGTIVTPAGTTTDSTTVSIIPGASNSPTTVANGGVAMRYLANGVTTVRAILPGAGFRALAAATRDVTVSTTAISLSTDYVGSGLQRSRSVTIGAPAPVGGVPITIAADRLGVVQFAPNATTLGVDTIVVTIPQGSTSTSFFVQGVEGVVADTVTLSASSPGFASATAQQRVWQGVIELSGLPTTLNTLAPDDPFTVVVGTPSSPNGGSIWIGDNVRFGAAPLVATLVSSTSTVGQLTTTARTGDTVTVQIPAGIRTSPSTVAAGGAAFQALTTGTTIVRASIPNFRAVAGAAGQTMTITTPALSLNTPATLGSGLQVSASGSLNAAQHGGVSVVVRSSNPALVRVAPSAGVVATDSIVIPLANGSTSFSYAVAAQDEVTGQASITARATGFTDAATTATVVAPAIQLTGVATPRPAFSLDDVFQVQIGVPAANNTALSAAQARRAGAAPLLVTITSSDPTVGALVTTDVTGGSVVVPILGGASVSPSGTANGGVVLRYLTPGSTTLQATHPVVASTTNSSIVPVTVTTPVLTLGNITMVGAGLQVTATGSHNGPQHGGLDIVIRSSNPGLVRVARTVNDVASDSIVVSLANGVTNYTYVVAGVEGGTGTATIEASAPAFTGVQGTATVATPAMDISGLVTTRPVGGGDDAFQVRVGLANTAGTQLASTQNVRMGSTLDVTVTSSVPAVGTLVTTALTAPSLTVQIAGGTSASPTGVATGGVAFRYLTAGTSVVQASHPAFTTVPTGIVTVTVTP